MMVGAALLWAATTLVIKASPLTRASAGKDAALSARGLGARCWRSARCSSGERITHMPQRLALGCARLPDRLGGRASPSSIWFALIARYSASRLSAFTFLTPLFGVAAGHLVLGEPLTPAFAAAVALVAAGWSW